MIRTKWKNKNKYIGEVVLYSKNGNRRLGSWGFRSKSGWKTAKSKAQKREQQIQYFKNKG